VSSTENAWEFQPEEPPTGPSRRRWRWVALAGVVVVIGGVALALVLGGDDGPGHPKAWDPRLAELVEFVEDERDLRFKHPVKVEFMDADDFKEHVRADEAELTAEDRQDIEDAAAMLRALALIDEDVDLFESVSDIESTGLLAYYSWEEELIRVRGTKLTPGVRVTVAHELTHVLQDQHFDLGRIQEDADESDADQQGEVLRGIAEGDANRIGEAYRESLSDADREAADEEEAEDIESFDADKHPPVLTALYGAPYALGEQLVAVIAADDGDAGIDAAFVKPPRFDKSLLDPLGYLDGERGKALDVPSLRDGEKELDSGGFGAFSLYLTLAQRLDAKDALAAADAWGGDAYVAYRSAGRVCVRTVFQGATRSGTDAIAAALDAWARPAPSGSVDVKRRGSGVVFEACDAKEGVPPGRDLSAEALLTLPATRAQIGQLVLESGGSVDQARCYANGLLEAFSIEQLQMEELPPAEMRQVERIGASCRDA
jgi:hypothetical protein